MTFPGHPLSFLHILVISVGVCMTASCTTWDPASPSRGLVENPVRLNPESGSKPDSFDHVLALNASTPPLEVKSGRILLDNDSAFEQKLELIRGARNSLDLAYYLFEDDYSSSLLAHELIVASRRGVQIRILLDYFNNYLRLDYLRALVKAAQNTQGTLEIRLYGRPTDSIISDAVYMTLGCAVLGFEDDMAACSDEKARVVRNQISAARQNLPPRHPVDYDSGGSGVFLSALYGMNAGLMAHSVLNSQNIDLSSIGGGEPLSAEDKMQRLSQAIEFARLYWDARASNDRLLQRTAARFKLNLAFLLFGGKLNPLLDTLSAYLPVRKLRDSDTALRDLAHLTDFLHHKLLLADNQSMVIGGRNIADAYHMKKNPLVDHYVFLDTDLYIDLKNPSQSLGSSFEQLWDFYPMVATLDQVERHAPNNFLMATLAADTACGKKDPKAPEQNACREPVFAGAMNPQVRVDQALHSISSKIETFYRDYQPAETTPDIPLKPGATAYYLENLPFDRSVPEENRERLFGSINGQEEHYGKHIHSAWLRGLADSCKSASRDRPVRIVMVNAYLLPPSNLMRRVAEMIDGTLACGNVHIDVLTNSAESTDLSIVNFFARYSLKAIADYYRSYRHDDRGVTLRYLELRHQGLESEASELSLHRKDMILGPDIFIGSANLDTRSLLMDSNNGLFLRGAVAASSNYIQQFDRLLENDQMVEDKTGWLARTSLDDMIAKDRVSAEYFFSRLLGKITDDENFPSAPLVDEVERLLRLAYEWSSNTLRGDKKAGERFDVLFKYL